MSIKTDATVIKNETVAGANTAVRVGTLLEDIADDLTAKQTAINSKQNALTADVDYLTPTTADATYEPIKGSDDNFVTDAEKVKLANLSGTNTGDQNISGIATNASAITTLQGEQTTQNTAISLNTSHRSNTSNPHSVTKTQVGLGNADNTSDANKPISTATQTALDAKQATLVSGTNIKTINSTSLLGSGNIDITAGSIEGTAVISTGQTVGKVLQADGDDTCSWVTLAGGGDALTANPLSQFADTTLTQLNGVISDATLGDSSDFATAAQGALADSALQSYTETDPIYSAWDKSTGISITASQVTDFDTEVSNNASVTANTAKVSYTDATAVGLNTTHRGLTTGNPHSVTKSDVGLSNVDNTSDANKPVSTATQTALNLKANLASPTFTGTVTLPSNTILPTVICFAVSDETTDLTTGTAKLTFRMPHAMTLTGIRASVTTAPTGSTLIVDVNQGGTTLMTTNKLSIDASEKTSTTAATAATLTTTALTDDAEITVDIDQVGSTVAGAGLKVTFIGTRN